MFVMLYWTIACGSVEIPAVAAGWMGKLDVGVAVGEYCVTNG